MSHSLAEIARALGARIEGRGDLAISGAAEPADAGPGDIALALKPEYADGLARGQAKAALLWDGADWQALGLEAALFMPRPRYALSGLSRVLDPGPDIAPGIDPMARIHPSARIGAGAAIAPFVVIGADVEIGEGARIGPHVSIARGARIGAQALLQAGVRIGPGVRIGDRFIANFGACVGGDGFSFVTADRSSVETLREGLGASAPAGRAASETGAGQPEGAGWTRIHSLGTVEIGDDVELGANATIDRGTIRATRVGSGTKIDNLVMIGHNVVVGRDCLFCSQVGIAGSARIGDRVVLAGQVGVNDNIFVGDDVIAGGATKIFTNAPAGRVLLGSPAVKMSTQIEINKALRRLPRLMAELAGRRKAGPGAGGPE